MSLTFRQKMAGVFKIAALFEAQAAGVSPSEDLLQGMALEKMLATEQALRPPKETATEPAETIIPSRSPATA